MTILGIDPGNIESAYVIWDGNKVLAHGKVANDKLIRSIRDADGLNDSPNLWDDIECAVIEMVACYGMAVGKEVFDTAFWAGRFFEARYHVSSAVELIYRKDVKMHLCHTMRATDSNIATALKDRFGPKSKKGAVNPVYGETNLANDEWQALALAVTWLDKRQGIE